MKRLYYEDGYIKEFKTNIEEIILKDGQYHIKLEETAFFEGGGGQPHDTGYIEGEEVIYVYEEGEDIIHVTNKEVIKKKRVTCKIDWERRFDYMQQHLGQHLLSGCFFKLLNRNTNGIHLGETISTIDIIGYLEEEEIRRVEEFANKKINENLKVEFLTPKKSELKKIGLRRDIPNTKKDIRVVKIEDLDINACCGVHPSRTIELQCIKIKRYEKHKGNTRIEYVAGSRAIEDYLEKDKFVNEISRYLSCGMEEAKNSIEKLNKEIKESKAINKEILNKLSDYEVLEMLEKSEKILENRVYTKIYDKVDIKVISKTIEKLCKNEKVIALVAIINDERVNFIFQSSKDVENLDMSKLLKGSLDLVDGRGGGSKNLAQGAGKNNGNVEGLINSILINLKN